jgi:methylamine dehydrogenase accessory protein MauD
VPSQNGAQRAAGLPVGTPAPSFSLPGLHGETLTLEALRAAGKPVVLLFTDPNCGPCTALLPEVRRWQRDYAEKLTVSLISRGTLEENRAKSTEQGLRDVLLQEEWEIAQAYQAPGTPSAVIVMPDGMIGSPVASGVEALESLVAYAGRERAQLYPSCGPKQLKENLAPTAAKLIPLMATPNRACQQA